MCIAMATSKLCQSLADSGRVNHGGKQAGNTAQRFSGRDYDTYTWSMLQKRSY